MAKAHSALQRNGRRIDQKLGKTLDAILDRLETLNPESWPRQRSA
jgi:hypothetical protein